MYFINRGGLYQGTTFSRAAQGAVKGQGFSPCKMAASGAKAQFLRLPGGTAEAVPLQKAL
jgi:hypothetical protein